MNLIYNRNVYLLGYIPKDNRIYLCDKVINNKIILNEKY